MRLALKKRDAVTEESQSGCAQNDAVRTGWPVHCAARVGHGGRSCSSNTLTTLWDIVKMPCRVPQVARQQM